MTNSQNLEMRHLKPVLLSVSMFVVSFLCLPSLYVIIWSFFGTSTIGTLGAFSLRWYEAIFTSRAWIESFAYSTVLAIISSLIATLSAVLYFYFSIWYQRVYQTLGYVLTVVPLFFPSVIYALALKVTFSPIGTPEWLPLVIGHVVLLIPIQYFLIESSNEQIKIEWIQGAATMGATHREIIRQIVFPLLRRPVFISFGIGLLFSFDEIVIASIIIDSSSTTVPKKMWDTINRNMDPTPAVVATVILFVSICVIFFYVSRTVQERTTS